MCGLLGRADMRVDEALLITCCWSVHTFGMRFPIDVVFVDRRDRVLSVHAAVRRGRVRMNPRAVKTLEMAAGAACQYGIAAGMPLRWEP
ncbi:DUF192 domain-containing protein [Burkholderia pyrrocinia]|nr:DUF192 domain-containing protein [Burkholderia pyrrocinia]TDA47479.1 DUF192 domain-containing protein [Burkholderia pyrrocinia]